LAEELEKARFAKKEVGPNRSLKEEAGTELHITGAIMRGKKRGGISGAFRKVKEQEDTEQDTYNSKKTHGEDGERGPEKVALAGTKAIIQTKKSRRAWRWKIWPLPKRKSVKKEGRWRGIEEGGEKK